MKYSYRKRPRLGVRLHFLLSLWRCKLERWLQQLAKWPGLAQGTSKHLKCTTFLVGCLPTTSNLGRLYFLPTKSLCFTDPLGERGQDGWRFHWLVSWPAWPGKCWDWSLNLALAQWAAGACSRQSITDVGMPGPQRVTALPLWWLWRWYDFFPSPNMYLSQSPRSSYPWLPEWPTSDLAPSCDMNAVHFHIKDRKRSFLWVTESCLEHGFQIIG